MNIQFMTKESNGIERAHTFTGEKEIAYIPNFKELIKNASCDEEIEMLKDAESRFNKNPKMYGFAFEICYTVKAKSLDPFTCKWSDKWQLMQHPWTREYKGPKATKEEMIETIERLNK